MDVGVIDDPRLNHELLRAFGRDLRERRERHGLQMLMLTATLPSILILILIILLYEVDNPLEEVVQGGELLLELLPHDLL